jgi:exodeoxyribonuclease VII large subunit
MTELEVPFVEKDTVKALGARWDAVRKKWYVPAGMDLLPFSRWLPGLVLPPAVVEVGVGEATIAELQIAAPKLAASAAALPGVGLFDLLQQVGVVVANSMPERLWLRAEISEFRKHASGIFITLVEYQSEKKVAQAAAKLWAGQAQQVLEKFLHATQTELAAGMQILISVGVSFHANYGLNLTIYDIDPNYTLGEMAAKLARIREQLQAEGITEHNKLLPMPYDFTRIAVISPESAAGLGDFRHEAEILQRYGLCDFTYFTAIFQGKEALASILQAFHAVLSAHASCAFDAIVVIRGGGAVADLAWLNELELARAICLAPVKVLVGVGHERDHTILDDVAGLPFGTPSKVINYIFQIIVGNAQQAAVFFGNILALSDALYTSSWHKLNTHYTHIVNEVVQMLKLAEQQLVFLMQKLHTQADLLVQQALERIEACIQEILLLGPRALQQRGFVIVKNAAQQVLLSRAEALAQAKEDPALLLSFHDGELSVCINKEQQQ